MRKRIIIFISCAGIFFSGLFLVLNIKVTTRQGIDYKVSVIEIPLYLKILNFYDRHFNYKWLVERIIKDKPAEADKIMALFSWVNEHIKTQPRELPVIDDHVWHIIVRGYGEGDQPSDVFTTFCNYAGFDAFFYRLGNKDRTRRITVSLVKIKDKWYVFEPRSGAYFIAKNGRFASIEEISAGNWQVRRLKEDSFDETDYGNYFSQIADIDSKSIHRFSRANIQSPLKRFIYGIKKGGFR
ncbi:MAG: hypothetical protein COV72_02205 [Candidatus Omnitrophica bacterium CG11_big_fil_rev_8_21_14_0_20_42_13]|uniref:Transglutaminase-like domain-containing protein n=1 Tax=Candidatus Ghiorseimicrobium undicola TaxID=1974746 RepID=A0A2H0LYZ1_9BACT|nr:MAG: hypothetical protein COV72_02205 [Candidatus Omnitrophica bacterium CG11_big_fil_rev_8_21_14_0_20_42_13]